MAMNKTHIFSDMSQDTRKEWCAPCLLVADFFSSYFVEEKKLGWILGKLFYDLVVVIKFFDKLCRAIPSMYMEGSFQNSVLDIFTSGSRYLLFLRENHSCCCQFFLFIL